MGVSTINVTNAWIRPNWKLIVVCSLGVCTTVETVCRGGRKGIFRGGRRNRPPLFFAAKNSGLQERARQPPLKKSISRGGSPALNPP